MGEALKKSDIQEDSLSLGIEDGLTAAFERAFKLGSPDKSVLSYVSSDEWKEMSEQDSNILVFDPE